MCETESRKSVTCTNSAPPSHTHKMLPISDILCCLCLAPYLHPLNGRSVSRKPVGASAASKQNGSGASAASKAKRFKEDPKETRNT